MFVIPKNRIPRTRVTIALALRIFGFAFRKPTVVFFNEHEFSDHLLRDLGVLDGDRSDR
ncbi:hypothetical protein [Microvirga pakistanensis]|uniref:hypothetical protein n=1 Tax=Microvirga pakistanensis TaxID=1682650 RepID=UPI00141BC0AD|nr:hypothetical protein [Microvirga pakistanensis]